jgi:hypothetical protein
MEAVWEKLVGGSSRLWPRPPQPPPHAHRHGGGPREVCRHAPAMTPRLHRAAVIPAAPSHRRHSRSSAPVRPPGIDPSSPPRLSAARLPYPPLPPTATCRTDHPWASPQGQK